MIILIALSNPACDYNQPKRSNKHDFGRNCVYAQKLYHKIERLFYFNSTAFSFTSFPPNCTVPTKRPEAAWVFVCPGTKRETGRRELHQL